MALGRRDKARAGGGAGAVSGPGSIWTGRGITAAGLSAETNVGGSKAAFTLDTGTVSSLMLAGIVVGFVAYYLWTRGSQR